MTASPRTRAAWFIRWALRLGLSALFVYAGAVKMRDPQAFADSVASFQLLPDLLITPAALTLPPLEIMTGLLALSINPWRRVGAFCLMGLLLLFTVALLSASIRGLHVDCGCFGSNHFDILSPTRNLWLGIGRDLLLTAVAGYLYAVDLEP